MLSLITIGGVQHEDQIDGKELLYIRAQNSYA